MLNLGVSLYSFQADQRIGLPLQEILKQCAEIGAVGIEMVPEQSIMDYQFENADKDFVAQWKDWMAKYGLTPTNCNLYDDLWIYPHRPLTDRERLQKLQRGFRFARDMGFRSARVSVDYGYPDTKHLEDSVRIAEDYGVIASLEIHSPYSLKSNWAQAWFNLIDRTGTKFAGIHPDGGIFDVAPRARAVALALEQGANPDIVAMIQEEYPKIVKRRYETAEQLQLAGDYRKTFGYGEEEIIEKVKAMGGGRLEYSLIGRFSCDDPAWLIEYQKYIVHFHGKFYDMVPDADGDLVEPSINYPGIVEALVKMDYPFWISTEWEGMGQYDREGAAPGSLGAEVTPTGKEFVGKFIKMIRKYEAQARAKLGK